MKLRRVDCYPDCVRIITESEAGGNPVDQSLTHRDAARLLAGLEVALAAALRDAGRGKCLKCGRVVTIGSKRTDTLLIHHQSVGGCWGVLTPVKEGAK